MGGSEMQTTMQPINFTLFAALLLIAALVGLLGAYLADGEVVDGDLTYWPLGETLGLPGPTDIRYAVGVAMLYRQAPVAVFHGGYGFDVCWFDGEAWHREWYEHYPSTDVDITDMEEAPDGKVWLKTWYSGVPGLGYIDWEGYREPDGFPSWYGFIDKGWSVDCISWAGADFLVVGQDVLYGISRAAVFDYCRPSCDEMTYICDVYGPDDEDNEYWAGCELSGHFLGISSCMAPFRVVDLLSGTSWDHGLPSWPSRPVGSHGYFWVGDFRTSAKNEFLQVDARTEEVKTLAWASGMSIESLLLGHRGLWIFGRSSQSDSSSPLFVGYWSFQEEALDDILLLDWALGEDTGTMWGLSRHMTHSMEGALWFATEKAVCRWAPENIPMPYEARVDAQAKGGGINTVEIEFDNRRIIRNDADLMLALDYLVPGSDEPLGISPIYALIHEFEPHETFYYSFEHVPEAPPEADRIRYRVFTTVPEEVTTITSNVATAEVALTH